MYETESGRLVVIVRGLVFITKENPPFCSPAPLFPGPPSYLPHLVLLTGPTSEEPRTAVAIPPRAVTYPIPARSAGGRTGPPERENTGRSDAPGGGRVGRARTPADRIGGPVRGGSGAARR